MSEQASEGELVKYLKVESSIYSQCPRENEIHPFVHAPSNAIFSSDILGKMTSNSLLSFNLVFSHFLPSSLESPCNGGSCDGQLSAHHPQPAVLCPNQSHTWGRGRQRDQASHMHTWTHTCMKCMDASSRKLCDTAVSLVSFNELHLYHLLLSGSKAAYSLFFFNSMNDFSH